MMGTGPTPLLTRVLRRAGSRSALALLGLMVGLCLAAPVLPLPHPAVLTPEASRAPPALRWEPLPDHQLSALQRDHPLGTAAREALWGRTALVGLCGTDALGRDTLSRILWGGRVSLLVGLVATLVSMVIGVGWGLTAGMAGGRLDQWMMRLVDGLYAVPFLFVVILLIAVLREHAAALRVAGIDRLVILFVVIGAISWLTMARLVRGQVLAVREREFVTAARALGATGLTVALRHVLPHLWGLVVVTLTLTVPRVILFEAFLSFLGLGVEPPGVSWGTLAAEGLESLTAVGVTWWLVVFPSLALAVTLASLNTLGDALRDALDPRRPHGLGIG